MVPPLQEHLDQLQAKARARLKARGQAAFIRKQRKNVAAKLRKRGTATNLWWIHQEVKSTSGRLLRSITEGIADARPPCRPLPWMEEREEYVEQLNGYRTLQRRKKKLVEKHFSEKMAAFHGSRKHDRNPTVAQTAQLLKKNNRLDLHGNLAQAESSPAVENSH